MGQKVLFDGQLHTEPTTRARIVSGVSNFGAPSSFGNICIIDTGLGAGYGGGKGVLGSGLGQRQFDEFVNTFSGAAAFKTFVKGGVLWDLADYIFNPTNSGQGASTVHSIRAALTTQAQDSATTTNADTIVLNTLEEGLVANGVLDTGKLKQGYAWTITAGVKDPLKFIFKFFQGTYRGVDADGLLFDGLTSEQSAQNPKLITQSAEVATIQELIAWSAADGVFQEYFEFDATSDVTGTFVAGDLTLLTGFQLFAGATETYSTTALDAVLDNIKELDNSFFLSLDSGAAAATANNLSILGHINNEAEFKKFLIIGGGTTASNFATQSVAAAATLNSRYAILCDSGVEIPYKVNPSISQKKTSQYMAALVTGRAAGLEPQTPLTYKDLRITKLTNQLKKADRELAIDSGVLHVRTVPQLGFVINQGINTKQLNDFLINPDGSSPEISIERIEAQLNREIAASARVLFIGGNLATVNETTLEIFTKGYLKTKLVIQGVQDGLIVGFSNVKAVRTGTTFNVTYDFQANSPINKIFHTGTIIDPSIG